METFQSFLRPFNMSQLFPESILLHLPSEINLRRGVGELFPLLVRALHEKEIVAMQFLRGSRVQVTVRSEAYLKDLLSSEFRFEDTVVPVTPADCVAKSVYVRDLPFEVSDKSIVSVFSTYGKVYSVKSVYHKEFTSIRIVLMSINDSVPSIVNVNGFECRVLDPGKPAFCSVCRSSGHLPRACRRCKQPGHVARECVQAWIQWSLMSPPTKNRARPQSPRRLLSLILRLLRILFRLVRLPCCPCLSHLLLVLIKSPSSVSSAGPCPSRLIVRLPGVLLRLIVSSMVSCPSRYSLSASVILLSPMFRVLFLTTRKRLPVDRLVQIYRKQTTIQLHLFRHRRVLSIHQPRPPKQSTRLRLHL